MEDNLVLNKAIAALKAGERARARALLADLLRNHPDNLAAWLWLSETLDSVEQRRSCLERVLALSPGHPVALRGLAKLDAPPPLAAPHPELPPSSTRAAPPDRQTALLETILEQLQTITALLRAPQDMAPAPSAAAPATIEESPAPPAVTTPAEAREAALPADAEPAPPRPPTIEAWLLARGILVESAKQEEVTDRIFDHLALALGDRFESLQPLHDLFRRNQSSGRGFSLSLASATQQEIADITSFCNTLHQYAFLAEYTYFRQNRNLHIVPQRTGPVINFFTGGWFERYMCARLTALLAERGLGYTLLQNPLIILPNGDRAELDLLLLVEGEPLWVECKTGNFQQYVQKYGELRALLALPPDRALLVILGMEGRRCNELTHLYDLTFANEKTFLARVGTILGDAPAAPADEPPPVAEEVPLQLASDLYSLLNKAGLRPCTEHRGEVIRKLIDVSHSATRPDNLFAIKALLAEQLDNDHRADFSKSKLQDILNALLRGGCFLDEAGQPVQTFKDPIASLVATDPASLEAKCVEAYLRVLLAEWPAYFDARRAQYGRRLAAFSQVTGGQLPDIPVLERLKEEAQRA